jgi:hemolysin III
VSNSVHDTVEAKVHELTAVLKPRLRGVLHEAAFAVSLVTGTALVCLSDAGRERAAAVVYAVSVALLFGTSAAYHRGTWSGRSEEVMKRLDHSMIFVLIAGTYTPFALILLEGTARWTVLSLVWGGAALGVVLRNAVRRPARWLFVGLYLLLGWVALGVLPQLHDRGGWAVVVLDRPDDQAAGPDRRTSSTVRIAVRSSSSQLSALRPTRRTHQPRASDRLRATPLSTSVSSTCRSGWRSRVMTGTDRFANTCRVSPAWAPQATLRP